MNVTVPAASCPVPSTPTLEHEAAERSHEGHGTDYGNNQQHHYAKLCLRIHRLLAFLMGTDIAAWYCIRTLPKNKKATEPKPGRLFKRRNRRLSTCHHRRRAAWELLSSSPESRK